MIHQVKGLAASRPVLQEKKPEPARRVRTISQAYSHQVRMERPVQSREAQA